MYSLRSVDVVIVLLLTVEIAAKKDKHDSPGKATGMTSRVKNGEECSKVKRVLSSLNIRDPSMIPVHSIHDSTMDLCFKAKSNKHFTSCCTHKLEKKFIHAVKRDFREVMRLETVGLKAMLSSSATEYQGLFHDLVRLARNKTDALLDFYEIPLSERSDALSTLYRDLHDYIKHKKVDINASVHTFFDKLFPLAFHYKVMDDNKSTVYTEKYRSCLSSARQTVVPQPFGVVPKRVSGQLQRAFATTRTFTDMLGLALEAVNTTQHFSLEKFCVRALARMKYCPKCQGHIHAMPCRGHCQNVLRGCLGNVQDLDEPWRNFIDSFSKFNRHIKGHFSPETILSGFDDRVSEAIMHAMETGPKYYPKIVDKCGHPQFRKLVTPPKSTGDHSVSNLAGVPGVSLSKKLSDFETKLLASARFYARLSDEMCKSPRLSADASDNGRCWTGRHLGRYDRMLTGIGYDAQVNNPDIKVFPPVSMAIMILQDKLVHAKSTLERVAQQNSMQADQFDKVVIHFEATKSRQSTDAVAGSGDNRITDDEDLSDFGSGSGDGNLDQHNGNTHKGGKGGGDDFDFESPALTKNRYPTRSPVGSGNSGSARPAHFTSMLTFTFIMTTVLWLAN